MTAEDALPPLADTELLFASYPPGLPTWEYFLTNLRGDFLEADAFVACQALLFVMVLPFARNLTWRRPGMIALFAIGSGLLMVSFFPLNSVLIDPVLAVTFGYCATLALLGSRDRRTVWRHLGPALAVLTLLKTTGALLALIALAVLVVRAGRSTRICVRWRNRDRSLPLWSARLVVGAACVSLAAGSWQLVIRATATAANWQARGAPSDAIGAFLGRGEPWRVQTTTSFIDALSTQALTSASGPDDVLGLVGGVGRATAGRRHARLGLMARSRCVPRPPSYCSVEA